MRSTIRTILATSMAFLMSVTILGSAVNASTIWTEAAGTLSDTQYTLLSNETSTKYVAATLQAINISSNSGQSWAAKTPLGLSDGWQNVFASENLSVIYAVNINHQVARSTDSGTTWTNVLFFDHSASVGGVSADGSLVTALDLYGRTWLSADFGDTFVQMTGINDRLVIPSPDKSRLFAVVGSREGANVPRRILTSINKGVTWTTYKDFGSDVNLDVMQASRDSSTVIIATTDLNDENPGLQITRDSGNSWTNVVFTSDQASEAIGDLRLSRDGERAVIRVGNKILREDQSGGWVVLDGIDGFSIFGLSLSASGERLSILKENSHIYTTTFTVPPDRVMGVRVTKRTPTTLTLNWEVPAANSAPLDGFTIFYRCAASIARVYVDLPAATFLSFDLGALPSGDTCSFVVAAYSELGRGGFSIPLSTGLPTAVVISAPVFAKGKATVGWSASDGMGSSIMKYEYCTSSCSKSTSWHSTGAKRSVALLKLKKGAKYSLQVRANNGAGNSPIAKRNFTQGK